MKLLEKIQFEEMDHPIYQRIHQYISATFMDGWHFVLPSNNECPCAYYFRYDEAYDQSQRTGVIIEYCRFIIDHYKGSSMYKKVLEVLPTYIKKLDENELGDMGPSAYVSLVEAMEKAAIPGYDYEALYEKLRVIVDRAIQKEPKEWQSYGYRPSDFIGSKQSRFYKEHKAIVKQELDFLCETLPENDVWANPWSWFENNDKYPYAYQLSTNWYKAIKAIERVLFLKAFDRLEEA